MKFQFQIKNSSLMHKIFGYFILIIILMFLLNIYSFYGFKSFNKRFYTLYNQLVETHSLTIEMDDIETEVVNYIHSGSSEYISEYNKKINKIQSEINSLKEASTGSSDIYYQFQDIHNMILTFDEKSKNIFKEYDKGISQIYMNQSMTELIRLNGYIDDQVKDLHFKKLIETQNYFYSIFAKMNGKENNLYIIIGIITLMCFIIAYRFSKEISVPIHKLVVSLKEVASGKFDSEPVSLDKNSGEIMILTDSFNSMKKQLRYLIDEITDKANLENELNEEKIKNLEMVNLLNQAELKFLQSQINPHFLFNTINTISALAQMENAQETRKLLESMSGILRFNLKKINEYVTLREEYQIITNYLNIQKQRFSNRISYEINVDEDAMDFRIPSMIIQPFVENAIMHGLEPKEGEGILRLKISVEDENIYILIEDNGIGMSKEKLEEVFASINGNIRENIGVANVIRRLELLYGKNVVDIYSEENLGTSVRIIILKQPVNIL